MLEYVAETELDQSVWEKEQKELKERMSRGEKVTLITGSDWFPRHYSREEIMEDYKKNNKYSWV